eukprot:8445809-Heterocapsa_arctica.AAC.1
MQPDPIAGGATLPSEGGRATAEKKEAEGCCSGLGRPNNAAGRNAPTNSVQESGSPATVALAAGTGYRGDLSRSPSDASRHANHLAQHGVHGSRNGVNGSLNA